MNETAAPFVIQVATSDIGGGAERVARDIHTSRLTDGLSSALAVGFKFSDADGVHTIPNDAKRNAWAQLLLKAMPPISSFGQTLSPVQRVTRRFLKTLGEPWRTWHIMQGYEDFDFPGTAAIPCITGVPADILHLHNLHGAYFDLRSLPKLSVQTPTVITAHDTWLGSGHCAYTLDCTRWKTGCGSCPYLASPPAIRKDRSAANLALKAQIYETSKLHLVGPSRWVLQQLEQSVLAPALVSTHHIPNGVNQDIFHPASKQELRVRLSIDPDAFVVVFSVADENNPYKDAQTIQDALCILAGRLSVDAPTILFLALGRKAESFDEGGIHIRAVPFLKTPSEVAAYLQASDLCAHLARAENHSLAVLEAQSCGLPVIASEVGGMPEAMLAGKTGILIPPEDPQALASTIEGIMAEPDMLDKMSEAAVDYARQHFSLTRMVARYEELYAQLYLQL